MAILVGKILGFLALIYLQNVYGQLMKMTIQDNVGILEKMHPAISQVSKSVAAAVNEGDEMELLLTNIITKDLTLALEKLSLLSNITIDNFYCCTCKRCTRYARICGRSCCANGSQGCKCVSCSSSQILNISEVSSSTASSIQLWKESAKDQLRDDVMRLVGESTANSKCCLCAVCQRKRTSCFIPTCCAKGGKLCKCISCSSGKVDLIADSISNPISLTAEAEAALDQVDALVDSLFALHSYP